VSNQFVTPEASLNARERALDWLLGRINYERSAVIPYNQRQLKLDRMRQLLTRLGQPDAGMKIVHVAGTKGKGSTSAMIAGVLSAAGFRTGVFSSPHLQRIEERFVVGGAPCTSQELVALVDRVRPVAVAMDAEAIADGEPVGGPTYFEVTTAMALLHFVECQVDAAVLEVGLGGRLDSTNVCLPAVSVITSISFDHMKQLGDTLAAIAREKAGIIKPGVPVVSGVIEGESQAVVSQVAREHGCRLIQLGREFSFDYRPASINPAPPPIASLGTLDFHYHVPGQEQFLASVPLAMHGRHQAANAAVALAVLAELRHQGWCISQDAIREGMSCAALPGRVEVVAGEPTIVLDAAHNPASARALVQTLDEMSHATRRTLIVSISRDKDVSAIVDELAPCFDRFVVTQYQDNPRAMPAAELAQMFRDRASGRAASSVTVCAMPETAWRHVGQTVQPGELVCISGSFYLAAEMRPLVME
jgi:dihydrofolate synthase / folylpolyglutamate synthase